MKTYKPAEDGVNFTLLNSYRNKFLTNKISIDRKSKNPFLV